MDGLVSVIENLIAEWTFLFLSFLSFHQRLAMSSNVPINQHSDITAPTPQNTPLSHAPITAGLHRPTVPDMTEDAEPGEDSTTVHEAMLGLVQGRLAGLLGKSSGYVENLPDGAKKTIEALKGVQVKQSELQNQYKRECLELEKKASHLYSQSFFLVFSILSPTFCPHFLRFYPLIEWSTGWVRTMPYLHRGVGDKPSHPSPIVSDPE